MKFQALHSSLSVTTPTGHGRGRVEHPITAWRWWVVWALYLALPMWIRIGPDLAAMDQLLFFCISRLSLSWSFEEKQKQKTTDFYWGFFLSMLIGIWGLPDPPTPNLEYTGQNKNKHPSSSLPCYSLGYEVSNWFTFFLHLSVFLFVLFKTQCSEIIL